jgi:hypothetical protein
VARLGIEHAVLLDTNFALWREYENAGWPGRYLWNADGMLADYHYGEGAYAGLRARDLRAAGRLARAACAAATRG